MKNKDIATEMFEAMGFKVVDVTPKSKKTCNPDVTNMKHSYMNPLKQYDKIVKAFEHDANWIMPTCLYSEIRELIEELCGKIKG